MGIHSTGYAVTVNAMPAELTTTAAAQLLGVSRPTLMRKINAGEIPSHKVGSHTRLRTADVLKEQHDRRQRQLAAFDELRALEDVRIFEGGRVDDFKIDDEGFVAREQDVDAMPYEVYRSDDFDE